MDAVLHNLHQYIVIGIGTLLAVTILAIPQLGTQSVAKSLEWLFMTLLPNFCLGQGVSAFYSNFMFLNICKPLLPICSLCGGMNITYIPCCKGMIFVLFLCNLAFSALRLLVGGQERHSAQKNFCFRTPWDGS